MGERVCGVCSVRMHVFGSVLWMSDKQYMKRVKSWHFGVSLYTEKSEVKFSAETFVIRFCREK